MPVSDELLRRYRVRLGVYRDRASGLLVAAWDGLAGVGEENVEELAGAAAGPLAGVKAATVALTAGFFAMAAGSRPVAVRADEVPVEADLRGPFLAAWHALRVGRPFDEARQAGRSTAQATGFDFVQRTARRAGGRAAEKAGVEVEWRRVPGPKACPWCREKAQYRWPTADAADFGHERCDCVTAPA